jgi:hypothetical protein
MLDFGPPRLGPEEKESSSYSLTSIPSAIQEEFLEQLLRSSAPVRARNCPIKTSVSYHQLIVSACQEHGTYLSPCLCPPDLSSATPPPWSLMLRSDNMPGLGPGHVAQW